MKFSISKLLKFYFGALALVLVLGFAALLWMIPHKNRSQQNLLAHPHVQAKLAEGFRVVEKCGSYKRKWNYEFTSLCLEKSSSDPAVSQKLHEVFVHETGSSATGCEYRAISPTDTICFPKSCFDSYWAQEYRLSACLGDPLSTVQKKMPFIKYESSTKKYEGTLRSTTIAGYVCLLDEAKRLTGMLLQFGSSYGVDDLADIEEKLKRDDEKFFHGDNILDRDGIRYHRTIVRRAEPSGIPRLDVFVQMSPSPVR